MNNINNLEQIKEIIVFENKDAFYHLQIIKRKKEHPELGSNNMIVKTYYIQNIEYLEMKMPEIIFLCNYHNARAGINLNKRSFEKLAFQMLKKVTDCILNKNYKAVRKSYESVCGQFSNEKDKKWIIDIDIKDLDFCKKLESELIKLEPFGQKVKSIIETKKGYHLITSPFNVQKYNQMLIWQSGIFEKPEIHKNNPTILYCPIIH
ncbi:MAG: hypothetical protein B6I24_04880 [Bacteroidetes bacterium 4572_128]|nr:MAG: hypothetical protein B6I24_04880 [Bacteroidetes bacterium 4572_128]